jgi:hypothetical protein
MPSWTVHLSDLGIRRFVPSTWAAIEDDQDSEAARRHCRRLSRDWVDFQCCIESTISVRRNLTFARIGRPG